MHLKNHFRDLRASQWEQSSVSVYSWAPHGLSDESCQRYPLEVDFRNGKVETQAGFLSFTHSFVHSFIRYTPCRVISSPQKRRKKKKTPCYHSQLVNWEETGVIKKK